MNKLTSILLAVLITLSLMIGAIIPAAAEPESAETKTETETTEGAEADDGKSAKAVSAAIAVGLAALGGALAMGIAVGKTSEAIARQPEAVGEIRGSMMLGLVFIETAIIYALIIAILVIFVL